jgi:hypothetical protein
MATKQVCPNPLSLAMQTCTEPFLVRQAASGKSLPLRMERAGLSLHSECNTHVFVCATFQWAGEVISTRDKTSVTDDFKELEHDIEVRKEGMHRYVPSGSYTLIFSLIHRYNIVSR